MKNRAKDEEDNERKCKVAENTESNKKRRYLTENTQMINSSKIRGTESEQERENRAKDVEDDERM